MLQWLATCTESKKPKFKSCEEKNFSVEIFIVGLNPALDISVLALPMLSDGEGDRTLPQKIIQVQHVNNHPAN